MTEPFVFHFSPGPGGRLEAMYMLDLDCHCGLCGHEQFQRFYHSTPFHELTVPGLDSLVDEAALKAGYECENCGEPVGAAQVRNICLTYGFSDDAGVIRIFENLEDGTRRWELTARRRFDPQAVPRWKPDPETHPKRRHVLDRFDESTVEEVFGRPFNAKLAWRDLLEDILETRNGGQGTQIGSGLWAVAGCSADVEQFVDSIGDEDFRRARNRGELLGIPLADSAPDGLPSRSGDVPLEGRFSRWLPERVLEALGDGRLAAAGFASMSPAVGILERTFEVGRLSYDKKRTGGDTLFENLTTPTDTGWDGSVSVESVLRRAVHTGVTVGEAARLTAEEIIAALLQVW